MPKPIRQHPLEAMTSINSLSRSSRVVTHRHGVSIFNETIALQNSNTHSRSEVKHAEKRAI